MRRLYDTRMSLIVRSDTSHQYAYSTDTINWTTSNLLQRACFIRITESIGVRVDGIQVNSCVTLCLPFAIETVNYCLFTNIFVSRLRAYICVGDVEKLGSSDGTIGFEWFENGILARANYSLCGISSYLKHVIA